ncbi:MAG: ATP synthase F0 subunit B [Parcubacteria group bacterium]|nr:ATP synthase F0 subunit B [Parcubacteria group bacterium]
MTIRSMQELLGTLGIDWRLLIGQIINFGLFLLILRIFAYKPLLEAMQKRTKRIEEGLKNADQQDEIKAAFEKEKKKVLKEAGVEAAAIVAASHEKAVKVQEAMLAQAEDKVREMGERAKNDIQKEKDAARDEMKQFAGELSIAISEKILKEKVDGEREQKIIKEMLKEIH